MTSVRTESAGRGSRTRRNRLMLSRQFLTGGHPDPAGVLEWLRGDAPDPWSGWQADFPEDSFVYEAIRERIHPST
jgi:hypothetical protein